MLTANEAINFDAARFTAAVVPGIMYSTAVHQMWEPIRMLDAGAWADAEALVRVLIDEIVAPYGVTAEIDYKRGVPPVVNDQGSTRLLGNAVRRVLGQDGHVPTAQSLGGEDFGWFVERVPGAMGRLGTRTPGGATYDLHQGNLTVDERATAIGARVLAEAAVTALVTTR